MVAIATAQFVQRNPGVLKRKLKERTTRLLAEEQRARKQAADVATARTRAGFAYKRPVNVPKRRGRNSTNGRFRDFLTWEITPNGVKFDAVQADDKVPYWIIQEIGTGQKATLKQGGQKNPQGRPAKGASYVRSVSSQVGRIIPASLVWATGPRGSYVPAGGGHGQQLFLRSKVKGVPNGLKTPMVIGEEIQGQHFVQQGGEAGFREYKVLALAAARRAFAGQRFKP